MSEGTSKHQAVTPELLCSQKDLKKIIDSPEHELYDGAAGLQT